MGIAALELDVFPFFFGENKGRKTGCCTVPRLKRDKACDRACLRSCASAHSNCSRYTACIYPRLRHNSRACHQAGLLKLNPVLRFIFNGQTCRFSLGFFFRFFERF